MGNENIVEATWQERCRYAQRHGTGIYIPHEHLVYIALRQQGPFNPFLCFYTLEVEGVRAMTLLLEFVRFCEGLYIVDGELAGYTYC
jgi:hypothetical protein